MVAYLIKLSFTHKNKGYEPCTVTDFEVPKMPRLGSHGLRRAMRFQVWDASAVATDDGVMCEFSIDKGSYATAVLREVMKKDVY